MLFILFLIGLVNTRCVDYKLDCLVTQHNETLWVTSVEESCKIENPGELLEKIGSAIPCYKFIDDKYKGDFITPNCNLRVGCKHVKQNHPLPTLVLGGTCLVIFLFAF